MMLTWQLQPRVLLFVASAAFAQFLVYSSPGRMQVTLGFITKPEGGQCSWEDNTWSPNMLMMMMMMMMMLMMMTMTMMMTNDAVV